MLSQAKINTVENCHHFLMNMTGACGKSPHANPAAACHFFIVATLEIITAIMPLLDRLYYAQRVVCHLHLNVAVAKVPFDTTLMASLVSNRNKPRFGGFTFSRLNNKEHLNTSYYFQLPNELFFDRR